MTFQKEDWNGTMSKLEIGRFSTPLAHPKGEHQLQSVENSNFIREMQNAHARMIEFYVTLMPTQQTSKPMVHIPNIKYFPVFPVTH